MSEEVIFGKESMSESISAVNRRGGEDGEEGMDDWDQEKLEAVVNQKHGTERNRPTDIICKFFLDAVERKQYGW